MQVKLAASDNVLTTDRRREISNEEAATAAGCAALAALNRGWEPNPSDPHGMSTEMAKERVDNVIGLAAEAAASVIALGHSAVAWLDANDYVVAGHLAFLDDKGFYIVPEVDADVVDALRASTYDPEQGWPDTQLVTITDQVTGVRDPYEDRPGHEAYQILFNKDEQTGGGICYTPGSGWQSFGPIVAITGEILDDRYPKNHPSFPAAVTWMAATLAREFATPMNMYEVHHRLVSVATHHEVELNRLHAYMAGYDDRYDDLPAELLTAIASVKTEIRARQSPTTLAVPTDVVPDPGNPAPGARAAQAWITAAENAGFEIQGWTYYFPGSESEDSTVTCAGAAIGYRWYALDVMNGTVKARDTETVATDENIALWDQPQ